MRLRGVDPAREYVVTDVRTGETTKHTGAELEITLPPNGAAVLQLDPA